jgi:quercetin dioxygenase-like cupin family protein
MRHAMQDRRRDRVRDRIRDRIRAHVRTSVKSRRLAMATSLAVAILAATLGMRALQAQQPGFKRVELQRHDLATPGHEAVLARGDFNPGASVPKHTHPGEEIAYLLEGQITLEIEGKPPVILKAGDSFFVAAGQVHAAKNTGAAPAKILSTYIVEKGKPLATPVK